MTNEWDAGWEDDESLTYGGNDSDIGGFGDLSSSSDETEDNYVDNLGSDEFDEFDDFDNFDDSSNNSTTSDNNGLSLKIAIIGVVALIVIVFIARFVIVGSKNKSVKKEVTTESIDLDNTSNENSKVSQVDMSSGTYKSSGYIEIDGNDKIELNGAMSELQFTITGIKHYAKNNGNELRVKTVLTGALSGYSGSYDLEVPYSKGISLKVGDAFTVYCRLGTFNNKVVIEEISY